MKFLSLIFIAIFLTMFSFNVYAADSSSIMLTAKVFTIPLILVWEYFVGINKWKSNSTIELIINFVKKFLGIQDSDLNVK